MPGIALFVHTKSRQFKIFFSRRQEWANEKQPKDRSFACCFTENFRYKNKKTRMIDNRKYEQS